MNLIPLYVILPLGCVLLILILGRWIKFIGEVLLNLVLAFLLGLTIYFLFNKNIFIYKVGGWGIVNGVPIGIFLVMDGLTKFILLVISIVGLCSSLFSISYIKKFTVSDKYYALFSLMLTGMNGAVISGDLFNIFVFIEIAAISSYALVAFGIRKEELEASFKYQVMGGLSSMMILLGIGIIYWKYSTLNIADIGNLIRNTGTGKPIYFVQALFLMGFALKSALVPFHSWLPDAHSSAPSPISSMLSGVLIKSIGLYVIIRLFFNMFLVSYNFAIVFTVLGVFSMVIGVILAIGQWDIKRLLAYHSISQMGYIVTAIGIGLLLFAKRGDTSVAALSIFGGQFHLFNHAIFKGLLFLTAGSVEYQTDERDMRKIGGLAKQMPITSLSSFIGSMAIAGIPPFNGFFSKLVIIIAGIKAHYYLISLIYFIVSILTLASFLKLQRYTFFEKSKLNLGNVKESPFSMILGMVILAILCIITSSFVIPEIRGRVISPAVKILVELGNYSKYVLEASL